MVLLIVPFLLYSPRGTRGRGDLRGTTYAALMVPGLVFF